MPYADGTEAPLDWVDKKPTVPDAEKLAGELRTAVHAYESERDKQSAQGIMGVSDIGHCREHSRLLVAETVFSDDPSKWAAFVGTAIGDKLEHVVQDLFPTAKTGIEITVTLPSGLQLLGHPDLVTPTGVLDLKTVDGLTSVKRGGPSIQQQFQRHLYAAGLIQDGSLPEDCWVGNAWFDRSARSDMPHVQVESYDPTWLLRADEWLDDVLYAHKHGQEAPKDQPMEFCAKCCEFYSICRGEDAYRDREGGGRIEDPQLLDAVYAYVEAREAKKDAEKQMADAQRMLADTRGVADDMIVKWIHVNASEVPGHTRAPYSKLDIRKAPKIR